MKPNIRSMNVLLDLDALVSAQNVQSPEREEERNFLAHRSRAGSDDERGDRFVEILAEHHNRRVVFGFRDDNVLGFSQARCCLFAIWRVTTPPSTEGDQRVAGFFGPSLDVFWNPGSVALIWRTSPCSMFGNSCTIGRSVRGIEGRRRRRAKYDRNSSSIPPSVRSSKRRNRRDQSRNRRSCLVQTRIDTIYSRRRGLRTTIAELRENADGIVRADAGLTVHINGLVLG
jgi:hypothetical protein